MSSLVSPIEEFEMNSKCGRGRVLTALMSAQLMQVKKKRKKLAPYSKHNTKHFHSNDLILSFLHPSSYYFH